MSEYGPNGRLGDPPDGPIVCEECSEGPESQLLSVSAGEAVPALLCPECRGYLCSPQDLADVDDLAGLKTMRESVSYAIFELEQREKRQNRGLEPEAHRQTYAAHERHRCQTCGWTTGGPFVHDDREGRRCDGPYAPCACHP